MRSLYLCGAGNSEGVRLAQVINRERDRWDRIVLLDDDPKVLGRTLLGVEVVGGFEMLADESSEHAEVSNLIARTTVGRAAAKTRIGSFGLPFAALVDPGVDLSGVELAPDVTVYQNAILGPEVTFGDGSVAFMGAIVGHECTVGRCCVIAANAVLNARVKLEDGVYVGTNATVIPEVTVGKGATIGAGSVVVQDVPPGASVIGVPGQIIEAVAEPAAAPTSDASASMEATVSRVWEEVLLRPEIAPGDNFFDIGGNSLLAIRLRERIEKETAIPLSLIDLFRFPSVRALAGHLASRGAPAGDSAARDRAEKRRQGMQRRARARRTG